MSHSSPLHARFATTQWSIVVAAGPREGEVARAALQELCERYWLPVYAFVRRKAGPGQARDLTQAFFCDLLESNAVAKADRTRGRFRTFLLTAVQHFLVDQWRRERTLKRDGGRTLSLDFAAAEARQSLEPQHDETPERLFDRQWVLGLLDEVLAVLREEMEAAGKSAQFDVLKPAILGEGAREEYERMAQRLGSTPQAVKQEAYRMRKRYRELFRQQIRQTVESDDEVEEEIGQLLACL